MSQAPVLLATEAGDEGSAVVHTAAQGARKLSLRLGRFSLVAVALVYLGSILGAPLLALGDGLKAEGASAVWEAFQTAECTAALWNSLTVLAWTLLVNLVVGVAGALVLTRQQFWGRGLLSALVDLPLAVSPVMIGLGYLLLVGRSGLFASYLADSGFKIAFAYPGLVLATLFVTLPYTLREVSAVLAELGSSEEEAARTLGASAWTTFRLVTLPNIRLGLSYGQLMTLARALGEFGAVLVLGGSISGQTQTATTFIHDALEERQFAAAYGIAALLCAVSVSLLFALESLKRRLFQKGSQP